MLLSASWPTRFLVYWCWWCCRWWCDAMVRCQSWNPNPEPLAVPAGAWLQVVMGMAHSARIHSVRTDRRHISYRIPKRRRVSPIAFMLVMSLRLTWVAVGRFLCEFPNWFSCFSSWGAPAGELQFTGLYYSIFPSLKSVWAYHRLVSMHRRKCNY